MKHVLAVDMSVPQLHKLKKGKKVRIKKGCGLHLVVKPDTYKLCCRAFSQGKGTDLKLDAEELERNLSLTPEEHQALSETHMTGGGIFGPKFDRFLEKRGLRDVAYDLGDKIKPYAKAGAVGAITAGAAGLAGLATFGSGGTLAPLAPYLIPASAGLSALAVDYIDSPDKYHDTVSKLKGSNNTLAHSEAKAHANELINQHLGTNYDYMNRAGLENAGANELSKRMTDSGIEETKKRKATNAERYRMRLKQGDVSGSGIGCGTHHSRRKKLIEGGSIGLNGNHVSYVPQALVSQPFSANFAMSHMLPSSYQHLNNGGDGLGYSGMGCNSSMGSGLGTGCGLGTGLYSGAPSGRGFKEDAEKAYDNIRMYGQDLYTDVKPVLQNAFHRADALMHGKGRKKKC